MRTFLILAAFAAYCVAAPSALNKDNKDLTLQRPSPINPDVPMDPKPVEKITKITDPKEIAKFKRETDNKKDHVPITPTVTPEHQHPVVAEENNVHDHKDDRHNHRVKRDSTVQSNDKHDHSKAKPIENKQKPVSTTKPKNTPPPTPKRSHNSRTTVTPKNNKSSQNEPAKDAPQPEKHETVKHRQKRDDTHSTTTSTTAATPVNLENKNKDKEPHPAEAVVVTSSTPVPVSETHDDASEHKHSPLEAQVRPQIVPAFLPVGAEINPHAFPAILTVKRDIPVPLVPKHHHPDESPKDDDSDKATEESKPVAKKPEENKPEDKKPSDVSELHAVKRDDVQVEDLSDAVPLSHPKPASTAVQQHGTKENTEQNSHNLAHPNNLHHSFVQHEQQEQHHFQPQHPHVAEHQAEIAAQQKDKNSVLESSTSTTTEHSVLRHKPVPVAELFARHQQEKNTDA